MVLSQSLKLNDASCLLQSGTVTVHSRCTFKAHINITIEFVKVINSSVSATTFFLTMTSASTIELPHTGAKTAKNHSYPPTTIYKAQDRLCTCNGTLKRVRVTTVAVEKQ